MTLDLTIPALLAALFTVQLTCGRSASARLRNQSGSVARIRAVIRGDTGLRMRYVPVD